MQTDRRTNLDLPKECDHVVAQALAGQNTIVMMGPLIFLAYASGDAFALDVEDKYACPLCIDGERVHFPLFDTGTKWEVIWPWRFFTAKGRIHFEATGGSDSSGLPWLKAGGIERYINRYNRKAGTNYHL